MTLFSFKSKPRSLHLFSTLVIILFLYNDSLILKTRSGYVQECNAQAVVNKGQIIITADVTQEENDVQQLYRMTEEDNEGLKAVGVKEKIRNELADARYRSEDYSIRGGRHQDQLNWLKHQGVP